MLKFTRSGKKEVLLLDEEGNELSSCQSLNKYRRIISKGESIRAVVRRVDLKNNSPVIILSRNKPRFSRQIAF